MQSRRPSNLAIIPIAFEPIQGNLSKMGPEQEPSQSAAPQSDTAGARPAPRRGRGPGRGHRGHGRRRRPKPIAEEPPPLPPPDTVVAGEPEPIFELAAEQSGTEESDAPAEFSSEEPLENLPASAIASAPRASQEPRLGSEPSVQKAIEEVSSIVDSLRGALDTMEEVLEMLELFERQQNVDEQEIESLRRALRQIHRPRDSGHPRR